jgi:formylglycine-generating enzyme required for sulfatase activity
MALLIVGVVAVVLPQAGFAQGAAGQEPFQEAGVCARCHVISVVEWGMSGHRKASTGCTSCHGASLGHIQDERNNVKPDRIAHGNAIGGICADCHKDGCPKSGQKAGCADCHHFHALVDPRKPASAALPDSRAGESTAPSQQFTKLMAEGENLAKSEQWEQARAAFESALQQKPGDVAAVEKVKLCRRRLNPDLPGFEIAAKQFDSATGLARKMRVSGLGIPMVLVPGGEFEMGSERFPGSKPVHTVRVRPLYLGEFEVSQAEWKSVMGSNPSTHQGEKFPQASTMPVESISWEDAQAFVRKLNEKVPSGGFRLPTEAEWEFAARTGGAEPEPAAPGSNAPRPVGKGHANSLGLYDMLGNVWEWCSSLDRPYPFDPADGREFASGTGLRVLRGGGFVDPADLLDPSLRHGERPGRQLPYNGLRLARDIPDPR